MKTPRANSPNFGKIVWNERMGPAANARRKLPGLISEYYAEVRRVLATDPEPPELHALRLATKKVRYTLELFRHCYSRGLKERMEMLKSMQQLLGDVNDCVASAHLIRVTMPDTASRRRIEGFLHRQADLRAATVRKEWSERFDAPGREEWWTRYLATTAKQP